MPPDFDFWKNDLRQRIRDWLPRMRRAGVTTSYGVLCAASLMPVIAAWQQGDMATAMAFAGLAGSIGANLLTNVIQSVKDHSDEDISRQILQSAEANPEIRADLDKLLQKLDAVSLANNELEREDRTWFENTLRTELTRLHSSIQVLGDANRSVFNTGTMTGNFINTGTFVGNVGLGERSPAEIKRIYCETLVKSTGHVYLQGLMPGIGTPESSQQPLALANVYIDLDVEIPGMGGKRSKDDRVKRSEALAKKPEHNNMPDVKMRHVDSQDNMDQAFKWLESLAAKQQPNTALHALAETRQMVLLGEPGSGKSTLVRFLCHCLAKHCLEPQSGWLARLRDWPVEWADFTPIPVILRDFAVRLPQVLGDAHACALMDFVKARLKEQNLDFANAFLEEQLEGGRALVMLDGLDEVPDVQQRRFVLEAVRALIQRYPKNLYMVTCRVLSYQPPTKKDALDLRLRELPDFTLAPFSDEKTDKFIDAWFTEIGLPEKAAGLRLALQRSDTQLAALSSNPLLLTEMAVAHVYLGELPDKRVKLYDAVVDLLLYRWDTQKFGEQTGDASLTQLLKSAGRDEFDLKMAIAQLALEAQSGKPRRTRRLADISDGRLLRKLADLNEEDGLTWAGKVVNLIQRRAGLLIEREPGVYTFPHRTFQEYLAGVALAWTPDFVTCAREKARQGDLWRLVIVLASGFMDQIRHQIGEVLTLVGELCPEGTGSGDTDWRAAWLAGDILFEVGLKRVENYHAGKAVAERVRTCLVKLLCVGDLSTVERARAGDTLAKIGDPRFDPDGYFLPKEDLLGFIHIPSGEFVMGSAKKTDPDAFGDEEPQHKLKLPEYYIARYPVTVAQFAVFVDQTKYARLDPRYRNDSPSRPVRHVRWRDALAYCDWLDRTLRIYPSLPFGLKSKLEQGWKITLPSEAEWEKAARGVDGRIYPWGNVYDPSKANTGDSGIGDTSVVGCFPEDDSPYHCLDMAGNVLEWTRSQWKDYPYNPQDGREDLQSNSSRALRGGAFSDLRGGARCASRVDSAPDGCLINLGFRVALVSPIFHL
jgi:formylglycine-generating enzyme required for sulfatase activity